MDSKKIIIFIRSGSQTALPWGGEINVLTSFQALDELSKGCKIHPLPRLLPGLSSSSEESGGGCLVWKGRSVWGGEEGFALHREATYSYIHTGCHVFCSSAEPKHIKSHLSYRFDPTRARLSCSLGSSASNYPCPQPHRSS